MLLNLLSNSLKYAEPQRPARIHVSVWVDADQPVLVVEDNGVASTPSSTARSCFNCSAGYTGTRPARGWRLYVVNRIVQARGGRIEVDGQEGAGASFRVWLGPA